MVLQTQSCSVFKFYLAVGTCQAKIGCEILNDIICKLVKLLQSDELIKLQEIDKKKKISCVWLNARI